MTFFYDLLPNLQIGCLEPYVNYTRPPIVPIQPISLFIKTPFLIYFMTILGPPCQTNMFTRVVSRADLVWTVYGVVVCVRPRWLRLAVYMGIGAREHEGSMKGTWVNQSNAKCFGNEFQSLHLKGNPHSHGQKSNVTTKERKMRKQWGGGALKRTAAPLFRHGRLYSC